MGITKVSISKNELLNKNSERRICERINLGYRARVELANGLVLMGSTLDVSLGGLLFLADQTISGFPPGAIAMLFLLEEQSESAPFPCEAVRISSAQAALKIDRKFAARFGKALTKGRLIRRQVSV